MKDDLPWFKHKKDARYSSGSKALIAEYGFEGYGRFDALLEIIASQPGARLDLSLKKNRAGYAGELRMSPADFEVFLVFLANPDECGLLRYEDGFVWSEDVEKDYSRVERKRDMEKRNYQSGQPTDNGNSNSDDGNADSDDGNDTEQSRAEKSRILTSKQAVKSNPARSESVDDTACLPAEVHAIKAKIKAAPFPSSFTNTDLVAFALRIQKAGIDAGFVDYCIERAARDRKTEKPAGLFKLGLLQYDDWLEEYRAKPPRPGADPREYETLAPPLESCPCGSKPKVNRRLGEAVCECGRAWTYDWDWEQWAEDAGEKTG